MRAGGVVGLGALGLAALTALAPVACGGTSTAPTPTLPPPSVNVGPPSAIDGPAGYEIAPTSAPVGGPPTGGAAAPRDAGVAATPTVHDAGVGPKQPTATVPPATTPPENPTQPPGGLPPTPTVIGMDAGPGEAPLPPATGDAGVPRLPVQPLGR